MVLSPAVAQAAEYGDREGGGESLPPGPFAGGLAWPLVLGVPVADQIPALGRHRAEIESTRASEQTFGHTDQRLQNVQKFTDRTNVC